MSDIDKIKSVVFEMAKCNDVFDFKWSYLSELNKSYDLGKLNSDANRLPRELLNEFVDGEESDTKELLKFYDLQYLRDYLTEVFNQL